jgi:hypothetical protein
MRASGRLGIRELVSRGDEIEARLIGELATIQESKPETNGEGCFF